MITKTRLELLVDLAVSCPIPHHEPSSGSDDGPDMDTAHARDVAKWAVEVLRGMVDEDLRREEIKLAFAREGRAESEG